MAATKEGISASSGKGGSKTALSHNGKTAENKAYEITVCVKSEGVLTKRISLKKDGSVDSDGSECLMSSGMARRTPLEGVIELADLIAKLESDQAILLGALRADLPDEVKITTKEKLLNGVARRNVIARTGDYIIYREGRPAFALLDADSKGMPVAVAAKIKQHGNFWNALLSVLPELRGVARVERRSTSSGLTRTDTDKQLPGSDNLHIYITVKDGVDIERFLRVLHDRCWLAGFGWMMLGKAGQLLERSIVDRMVGGAERLVFEGAPILKRPLRQDGREPVATEGGVLDTAAVCPPLTIVEKAKLDELKVKEAHRLAPEMGKVRAVYVEDKARELIKRKPGMTVPAARQIIERQCQGILLPDVVLPFDNDELSGCTVADVLKDPERFVGETMADPQEGVEYGRCCAKILRRSDGTIFIHSFAHGRTIYHLKQDAAAVRAAIEQADEKAAARTLVDLFMMADLDAQELEELRELAHKRSKTNKRTIDTMFKAARQDHATKQAKQERRRRAAARSDPRPQIYSPPIDAPWLPQMQVLNDVLGSSPAKKLPARNIDDDITRARKLRVPNTHAFTQANANADPEEKENSND